MNDEVISIIAVRHKVGPDQPTTKQLADAVEAVLPEEPVALGALTRVYSELGANDMGYLRHLGFDFDTANRLITVVWETRSHDQ